MGPGQNFKPGDLKNAFELGRQIARNGWILLSGGRSEGVMEEVNRGAKESGGLTIGILPDSDRTSTSKYVDIPIITGMGSGRNAINVLTSDILVICGIGTGTSSEISLGMKYSKPVILLSANQETKSFFDMLSTGSVFHCEDIEGAIALIRKLSLNIEDK